MGSGASAHVDALKTATDDELKAVYASLSEENRKKVAEALTCSSSVKAAVGEMSTSVELFGCMPSGDPVHRISLQSRVGDELYGAAILTRGATVQEVRVPDKNGKVEDIVLGFSDLAGYNGGANFCYGGTPGRYANRIANGSFKLEGKEHNVTANWVGPGTGAKHCLHGGAAGFDGKIWEIARDPWVDKTGAHVTLAYKSPDGEEGFPGALVAKVTYSWVVVADAFALEIKWEATSDSPTVVNLTNHTYFNLSGVERASDVLESHSVQLNCDQWTEVTDGDAIPTGQLLDVEGTPMDFRTLKKVGANINEVQGGGYDHNFVVRDDAVTPDGKRFVGRAECTSGRCLDCWATQPGVQFFTMQPASVFDKATTGKFGTVYPVHGGLCLETQHFPDSPNQAGFPSTLVDPGRPYQESCSYRFSVKKN